MLMAACGGDRATTNATATVPSVSPSANGASGEPVAVAPGARDGGGPIPIEEVDRVIESLRPYFKSCYEAVLKFDPTAEGSVVMVLLISPSGHVDKVSVKSPTSLPTAVTGCIAGVLQQRPFPAPGGTGSTLNVPISFVIKRDAGAPLPI